MDEIEFLRGLAAHHKETDPRQEQARFVEMLRDSIPKAETLLLEADGGIGKTLGYLVCGMREAQRKDRPLVIATSNITNRDQITADYNKIVEYAGKIGDPIADIRLLNVRSGRDYASEQRLDELIKRLTAAHAGPVLNELHEIKKRMAEYPFLDDVMPYAISYGEDGLIERRHLAARPGEEHPASFCAMQEQVREIYRNPTACVIIMTQAMLAIDRRFRYLVTRGDVALVVIDEVDKLTTLDYASYTNLPINGDIDDFLDNAEAVGVDVSEAGASLDRLQTIIDDIKSITPENQKNVILIHPKIGQERTQAVHQELTNLGNQMQALGENLDAKRTEDLQNDIKLRRLLDTAEELRDSADRLVDFLYPEPNKLWDATVTDLEVFLNWDEGHDEFRVVTARPGGLVEWMFRPTVTVPRLLTTAYLGEPENRFGTRIGLAVQRLTRKNKIRARPGYGTLKFIYFTPGSMAETVHFNPELNRRAVNPAHFDDVVRLLRSDEFGWKPGKRILVLTPGYEDIRQIYKRLNTNVPIFPLAPIFTHNQGSNINQIRDQIVQSPEGGILLTVYWEGYNIVGDRTDRRGLIDTLVMARIPFLRPNRPLETLHEYLHRPPYFVQRDIMIEAKRRIHQGFNRVIRGPKDKGVVLIVDSRFPPPDALTNRCVQIVANKQYADLLDTIPDRFREEKYFKLVDGQTFEEVEPLEEVEEV